MHIYACTYINEAASLGERVQRLLEALDEVLFVIYL